MQRQWLEAAICVLAGGVIGAALANAFNAHCVWVVQ